MFNHFQPVSGGRSVAQSIDGVSAAEKSRGKNRAAGIKNATDTDNKMMAPAAPTQHARTHTFVVVFFGAIGK